MTGSHLYLGTSDWGVIFGGVTHDYYTGSIGGRRYCIDSFTGKKSYNYHRYSIRVSMDILEVVVLLFGLY